TFMEQLPPSLEESARLDGAGLLVIYAHIIFPLSTPILATIAVFSAVGQWNSWQDNFFLVLNPKLQTVQYMLYNYIKSASYAANNLSALEMTDLAQKQTARISPDAVRMAVTFITTLPILLVYPFMQRYFIKGMMMGAIKG
ncbi:MAG: ABC transporter permease subunit, partial [Clostridia bacterium]